MRKAKVISEAGITEFEKVLNQWLTDNDKVKIISISYAAQNLKLPANGGQTMHVFEQSALIIYEI